MENLDIAHLRKWIGREEISSERLTCAITDRFNATFEHECGAKDGDVAPTMIHLCLANSVAPTASLAVDGHPHRGGFLPPVPLPRRMWAAGEFQFKDAILVGEMVTRHSVIRDVTVKHGRSGTLCFVAVEHQISSDDRSVLTERQDIVYRGIDGQDIAKNLPLAMPQGTQRMSVVPSQTLLFRYSALTFNSHRIHFDVLYAREIEGYRGLVVHGPMQATMLIQFAENIQGTRPARFEFRSLSPLFDDAEFTLNAENDGEALNLWTSYAAGPVAMQGRASW